MLIKTLPTILLIKMLSTILFKVLVFYEIYVHCNCRETLHNNFIHLQIYISVDNNIIVM